MPQRKIMIVAEFSIHPIGLGTSVGSYVRAAVRVLFKQPGLRYKVTPMSTILEAENISTILRAVQAAHDKLRSMGAQRISSMLRIDQRLDKPRTMDDKLRSARI